LIATFFLAIILHVSFRVPICAGALSRFLFGSALLGGLPAIFAVLWFVRQLLLAVVFLLAGVPRKLLSAVRARQCPVLKLLGLVQFLPFFIIP